MANADNHNRIIDLLLRRGPWKRSKTVMVNHHGMSCRSFV